MARPAVAHPVMTWQQPQQPTFLKEIRGMMYVFGDVASPSEEAAILLESIVHNEMRNVLQRLSIACRTRESQSLGLEDIFFLFRNDMIKLRRLLNVLKVKEVSSSALQSSDNISEDVSEDITGSSRGSRSLKWLPPAVHTLLELPGGVSILDVDTREDWVQRERRERADLQTRDMDVGQYMMYTKLRSANFHKDQKKFRDWLNHPLLQDAKVGSSVIDALGHICYDITRELVEVSLIVKWEQRAGVFGEGFQWWLPRGSGERGRGDGGVGGGGGGGGEKEGGIRGEDVSSLSSGISRMQGLEPVHIREALRRWSAPVGWRMGSRGNKQFRRHV